MDQSGFSTAQARNILRGRKLQTLLITIPATVLAAVGVIVLIPAIVWVHDYLGDNGLSDLLWSDYIFIVSMVIYFPLHMITAVYGHWLIEMISTFLGCLAICSGGGTLFYYGFVIKITYEEISKYHYNSDDYVEELKHYNLGFAGSFLSMLAVVASLTMMPMLKKFRERSSGPTVTYSHLPMVDNDDERRATGPPMDSGPYPPHAHLPHPAFNPGPVTQFAGHYLSPPGKIPQPAVHVPPAQPTGAPPYSAGPPQQEQPHQALHAFPSPP